jgi:hypothetical protein
LKTFWFAIVMATICFEGLGRKYLPQIPSVAFYFIKDVALLYGYYRFRPPPHVARASAYLYRGFKIFWVLGLVWTVIECFNPEQGSPILAVIGFRAYWLWWLAPVVMASVLDDEKEKRRAIYVLLVFAAGIAVLAALQFAAPPDSALNLYSVVDGEEVYATSTTVAATGRARVSSTFSFITGFSDFTILIPTLLLSIGLDAKEPRLRRAAFIVTCATAAVVPMSGSRSSVLMGGAILIVAAWTSGMFFTRVGRRILIGGLVAAVLAVVVFPDAFLGVQSRFEDVDETNSRYVLLAATLLPPVALATFEYPPFGVGTGMLQNAHYSLKVFTKWDVEAEVGRYLVELGPLGFAFVWMAKLGLVVALMRAYSLLKRAGRRGGATAALGYAVLTMTGALTFDHIWQALYFMGCGFILAEVVAVRRLAPALAAPETSPVVSARPGGALVSPFPFARPPS